MKKKILVITPFFYPHIGGSEKYIEGLYTFIRKKNPTLQVDVLTYNTNNSKEKEFYKGLTIYRIPCWTVLRDQFCLPKPQSVFKFLEEKGDSYDLIHCSTRFFDSSWWAPVYAKIKGKKIVLTDHCSYHPIHKNPLVSFVAKLADLTIVNLSLQLYDEIYSQNKKTQGFLKKTFNVSSKVAYPGLTPNLYKKRVGSEAKIAFVGRLIESKGVKNLFGLAAVDFPDADFVLAGPGPLVSYFKEKVRKEKIKNIKITGALTQAEVEKLLSESDIFAYPSFHSEGIPLGILEAGKYGLAVIATKTGAIDEVINNETGILVDNIEDFKVSLNKLIKDKPLRQKLGDNLQKLVIRDFTWDKAADLVLEELN